MNEIHIDLVVNTKLSSDDWMDLFIEWIETRGEFCGESCCDITGFTEDELEEYFNNRGVE